MDQIVGKSPVSRLCGLDKHTHDFFAGLIRKVMQHSWKIQTDNMFLCSWCLPENSEIFQQLAREMFQRQHGPSSFDARRRILMF